MERWEGRVALVTGASAGIGAAVARTLVKYGMKVVGCARDVNRIQKLADDLKGEKGTLTACKVDLTKEQEILAMFEMIKTDPTLGRVDVCVNNAGRSYFTSILAGKTEQWQDIFNVNVLALMICCRESYKIMKWMGIDDGHFFFINSLQGHAVGVRKDAHVYAASKHAVSALLHGLRYELREDNTSAKVTSISPGYVKTEMISTMLKGEPDARDEFESQKRLDTSDVVDALIYSLSSAPHVQIDNIILRPIEQLF